MLHFKVICLTCLGVDQPASPQQFGEVALYPEGPPRRLRAEMSGAFYADDEMGDGAARIR